MNPIISPRKITTFPVRVNPALLGSKEERDAHIDKLIAFESAHPTLHQKQTEEELQQLMGEANERVPQWEPSEADLRRMAAEFDEKFSEGRIHRPAHRINPHD